VDVVEHLRSQPWDRHAAREGLRRTLNLLNIADAEITSVIKEIPATTVRRIVVPGDLLYQAHHTLFPPERMLVAAGRRTGGTPTLGAVFEVTGANSAGHVKADPTRLARALIAMDLSGTYLAAWLHSHPGSGPGATRPSSIDLNQHQDWIRDYSPALLSAVVVVDGWIRFWGTALEADQIEVGVVGPGVITEDKDGYLYRLVE
jgi:proteasome lid subunit RPN8/RPN11